MILSQIPVSLSPYYNPKDYSFIFLSCFNNYNQHLKKILTKPSQLNCILCKGYQPSARVMWFIPLGLLLLYIIASGNFTSMLEPLERKFVVELDCSARRKQKWHLF